MSSAVRVAQEYARHPAVWRFLLPRQVSGPVVLANLDEVTTQNLLHSYPAALVLGQSMADLDGVARAAIWDGRRSPLRPGTVALLICDDRDGMCARALAPALAEGGECVAIVRSAQPYRFALFPTPEQLRAVIGGGWPLTYDGSPRRWLGYWLATTRIWRYLGRSGLAVRWPNDSVVDVVLDQVGATLGGRAYLRGLIAGRGLGQLTLRVRARDGSDGYATTGRAPVLRHRGAPEQCSPAFTRLFRQLSRGHGGHGSERRRAGRVSGKRAARRGGHHYNRAAGGTRLALGH